MTGVIKMKNIELWHGDCLDLMANIPDKSVDFEIAKNRIEQEE